MPYPISFLNLCPGQLRGHLQVLQGWQVSWVLLIGSYTGGLMTLATLVHEGLNFCWDINEVGNPDSVVAGRRQPAGIMLSFLKL